MFYAVTDVHGLESDCKKEEHRLSVNHILEFVSDAHRIPPMGFKRRFTLTFTNASFPQASTCSLELCIPVQYSDSTYNDFKYAMVEGLLSGIGFGKP